MKTRRDFFCGHAVLNAPGRLRIKPGAVQHEQIATQGQPHRPHQFGHAAKIIQSSGHDAAQNTRGTQGRVFQPNGRLPLVRNLPTQTKAGRNSVKKPSAA